MKKIGVMLVLLLVPFFSHAEEAKKTETVPTKPTEAMPMKPTGAMIACDQRVNKAALMKVLSTLPLKYFGTNFSLKSGVYYPAQVDDESFDVGVVADGQEYDVAVTMDEKCKKVLEVKIDK